MKTLESSELSQVFGGDSFWTDLAQFTGGFVGGLRSGFGSVPGMPTTIVTGAITAGLIAAAVH